MRSWLSAPDRERDFDSPASRPVPPHRTHGLMDFIESGGERAVRVLCASSCLPPPSCLFSPLSCCRTPLGPIRALCLKAPGAGGARRLHKLEPTKCLQPMYRLARNWASRLEFATAARIRIILMSIYYHFSVMLMSFRAIFM